jgi:hypothetical protein
MYKKYFDKPNIELWKTYLAGNSMICKLHIQMSNVHMCVVPVPASQDAVIKRVYTRRRVYSVLHFLFACSCST